MFKKIFYVWLLLLPLCFAPLCFAQTYVKTIKQVPPVYVFVNNGSATNITLSGATTNNGTLWVTNNLTANSVVISNGVTIYGIVTSTNLSFNVAVYTNVSADITLSATHNVVLVSGNTIVTLPSAANNPGRSYRIKKTDTDTTLTVTSVSGLIDGHTSLTITAQYTSIDVVSNGSAWGVF